MKTTVANAGAREDGVRTGPEIGPRLHVVRAERPRDQEAGRRFLIIANASQRLARTATLAEALGVLRSVLVPSHAERCTVHLAPRRGEAAPPGGACALRPSRLPAGHPLRECVQRRDSLVFSTTSRSLLRALDGVQGDQAPVLRGCVHAMLVPAVVERRRMVVALLRSFGRGPYDTDDLLVTELVLSRLQLMLGRGGARFGD